MTRFIFLLMLLLICTFPSIAHSDYREEFQKGFLTKTWSGAQPEENFCIECHSSLKMKPAFITITDEWKSSWHAQNSIFCHDCHGGDPKDPSMSMSPHRGFTGTPKYAEVPDFCGKCHIGILKNYLDSGHGVALRTNQKGPNCVTCHGSHNIQKANLEIINEHRCTKCHSYERAKLMKQAMFLVEKRTDDLKEKLLALKKNGVYVDDEEKNLFSVQSEFHTLFHTVDVNLVNERTSEFSKKLALIEDRIKNIFQELLFRKNFSAFILMTLIALGCVLSLLMAKKE